MKYDTTKMLYDFWSIDVHERINLRHSLVRLSNKIKDNVWDLKGEGPYFKLKNKQKTDSWKTMLEEWNKGSVK
jgi:hypothetical protein